MTIERCNQAQTRPEGKSDGFDVGATLAPNGGDVMY
jgi:hypothetical protein